MTVLDTRPVAALDERTRAFLIARLEDERRADRPRPVRGLDVIDDVLDRLRRGVRLDKMTQNLLLYAYGDPARGF